MDGSGCANGHAIVLVMTSSFSKPVVMFKKKNPVVSESRAYYTMTKITTSCHEDNCTEKVSA
jgi:hypothetical protein